MGFLARGYFFFKKIENCQSISDMQIRIIKTNFNQNPVFKRDGEDVHLEIQHTLQGTEQKRWGLKLITAKCF